MKSEGDNDAVATSNGSEGAGVPTALSHVHVEAAEANQAGSAVISEEFQLRQRGPVRHAVAASARSTVRSTRQDHDGHDAGWGANEQTDQYFMQVTTGDAAAAQQAELADFFASDGFDFSPSSLTTLFRLMDINGDGELQYSELRQGLHGVGIRLNSANEARLNALFRSADSSHSASISLDEFVTTFQHFRKETFRQELEKEAERNGAVPMHVRAVRIAYDPTSRAHGTAGVGAAASAASKNCVTTFAVHALHDLSPFLEKCVGADLGRILEQSGLKARSLYSHHSHRHSTDETGSQLPARARTTSTLPIVQEEPAGVGSASPTGPGVLPASTSSKSEQDEVTSPAGISIKLQPEPIAVGSTSATSAVKDDGNKGIVKWWIDVQADFCGADGSDISQVLFDCLGLDSGLVTRAFRPYPHAQGFRTPDNQANKRHHIHSGGAVPAAGSDSAATAANAVASAHHAPVSDIHVIRTLSGDAVVDPSVFRQNSDGGSHANTRLSSGSGSGSGSDESHADDTRTIIAAKAAAAANHRMAQQLPQVRLVMDGMWLSNRPFSIEDNSNKRHDPISKALRLIAGSARSLASKLTSGSATDTGLIDAVHAATRLPGCETLRRIAGFTATQSTAALLSKAPSMRSIAKPVAKTKAAASKSSANGASKTNEPKLVGRDVINAQTPQICQDQIAVITIGHHIVLTLRQADTESGVLKAHGSTSASPSASRASTTGHGAAAVVSKRTHTSRTVESGAEHDDAATTLPFQIPHKAFAHSWVASRDHALANAAGSAVSDALLGSVTGTLLAPISPATAHLHGGTVQELVLLMAERTVRLNEAAVVVPMKTWRAAIEAGLLDLARSSHIPHIHAISDCAASFAAIAAPLQQAFECITAAATSMRLADRQLALAAITRNSTDAVVPSRRPSAIDYEYDHAVGHAHVGPDRNIDQPTYGGDGGPATAARNEAIGSPHVMYDGELTAMPGAASGGALGLGGHVAGTPSSATQLRLYESSWRNIAGVYSRQVASGAVHRLSSAIEGVTKDAAWLVNQVRKLHLKVVVAAVVTT